jgi:peptidoglycan/xylan/chitin deacetylase (PgdA/CDA1 family)
VNFILVGTFISALSFLGACESTETSIQITHSFLLPTSTTLEISMTPSFTSSATVLPSITFTTTPYPDIAPTLMHTDVNLIFNGDRNIPNVALTFDICQDPKYPTGFDGAIVEALEKANAPATFFLGGDWIRTHISETLLLAKNPIFELGNHSWSHPDMRALDEAHMHQEIVKTQNILYRLTGRQARLFRLPAGLYNDLVLSVVAWNGLITIQWDVVTADPVPDNDAENINRRVRERVKNGSIIIMHANGQGWHTAEALPEMISFLRSKGYKLVTVSKLIGIDQ